MSAANISLGTAGAVAGGLWKLVAMALMVAILVTGGGWWAAKRAGDRARADLLEQTSANAQLRDSIREQNRAVAALAIAKEAADARGALAQQMAAANGRRFDGALAKMTQARATTCADAMPAVNQLLKDIQ